MWIGWAHNHCRVKLLICRQQQCHAISPCYTNLHMWPAQIPGVSFSACIAARLFCWYHWGGGSLAVRHDQTKIKIWPNGHVCLRGIGIDVRKQGLTPARQTKQPHTPWAVHKHTYCEQLCNINWVPWFVTCWYTFQATLFPGRHFRMKGNHLPAGHMFVLLSPLDRVR